MHYVWGFGGQTNPDEYIFHLTEQEGLFLHPNDANEDGIVSPGMHFFILWLNGLCMAMISSCVVFCHIAF